MNHRRRRISRVLLGVLAVTIAAGLFTYVRRLGSTQANEVVASAGATTPPVSTQPLVPAIPTVVGDKPVEPVKQSPPQQPPGPFRTETPTTLVTKLPTGASASPAPTKAATSNPRVAWPGSLRPKVATLRPTVRPSVSCSESPERLMRWRGRVVPWKVRLFRSRRRVCPARRRPPERSSTPRRSPARD